MAIDAGTIQVAIEAAGIGSFTASIDTANKKLTSVGVTAGGATAGVNKLGGAASAAQTPFDGLAGVASKLAAVFAGGWVMNAASGMAQAANTATLAMRSFEAAGGSIEEFRKQTGGMLSDAQLAQRSNLARTMGIPMRDLPKLANIAQTSAAITGQSFDYLFDSIVTGTARQSKMILDNLGLMINIEKANDTYAESLGRTASSLSDAEKKQAFLNAVLEHGQGIIDEVAASGLSTSNPYDKLAASMDNASKAMGKVLQPTIERLHSTLTPLLDRVARLGDAWDELNPKVKSASAELAAASITAVSMVGTMATLGAAVKHVGPALGSAFSGLGKSVMVAAKPLLLVTAVLAGIASIVGIVRVAFEDNWGGIADKATSVFKSIKTAAHDFAVYVAGVFIGIADAASVAFHNIKAMATGGDRRNLKDAGTINAEAAAMVGTIGSYLVTAGGEIAAVIKDGAKTSADFFSRAFGLVLGDMEKVLGGPLFKKATAPGMTFTGNELFDTVPPAVQEGPAKAAKEASDSWSRMFVEITDALSVAKARFSGGEIAARAVELQHQIRDSIAEATKAAAAAGDDVGAARGLAEMRGGTQLAEFVNAQTSAAEFSAAMDAASEAALRTGVKWNEVQESLKFEPRDFSDLVSGRIEEGLGAALSAFTLDIPASDKSSMVKSISDGLRDMLQGGKFDAGAIFSVLGRLLGAANIGGIGDKLTKAFGLGNLGAMAGPVGAVVGQAVSTVGPMIIGAFKDVAEFIVQAAQVIPAIISQAAQGIAQFIPSEAFGAALTKATDPRTLGLTALAGVLSALSPVLAGVAGVMGTALLPVTVALGGVLAVAALGLVGLGLAALYVVAAMGTLAVGTATALALLAGAVTMTVAAVGTLVAAALAPLTLVVGTLLLPAALALGSALAGVAAVALGVTASLAFMVGFFKLAMDTESFKTFKAAFEGSIGRVVKALEPFFQSLLRWPGCLMRLCRWSSRWPLRSQTVKRWRAFCLTSSRELQSPWDTRCLPSDTSLAQ